ncbi:MAG: hypothetical protein VKO44_05755 [Cyanobacteriota bacterium]|jgi:hypothetical protein|nr:hypothetical protein [Cyanobacteriota bacterium]
MDQFSFHGPFAYRWINDVPVERIDLRSGERRPIEVVNHGLPRDFQPSCPCTDGDDRRDISADPPGGDQQVRAAMAAWN